ncbi:N-acetylmuramoyl-L-alanine amidase-like domain-containing protein [Undibacterium sp. Ji83W]|uniref:N-acetylmuramoyl-L-alanine amidase-like domain-containing protein n=1 Tax=Undibacterium sp. Ji83W TaxID=3413043 RepID=UPI003BEF8126
MLPRVLVFALASALLTTASIASPVQAEDKQAATSAKLANEPFQNKKIFQMTPQEVDQYLAYLHANVPDLRQRIALIARKNIGQPYKLNLLGEFPFELHDNLPMYSLTHSDCLVFAEHTYAMALSSSWEEFFWTLQRIRYKDGLIGVVTRNHYTEVDWNTNNAWLLKDVSAGFGADKVASYDIVVDRAKFLREQHHKETTIPVQTSHEAYVKADKVSAILDQLRDGDFVNVVSDKDGYQSITHVGLVVVDANDKRNFLNSGEPQVKEESFDTFISRTNERTRTSKQAKPRRLLGFKFLRLRDDIVIPGAVTLPRPKQAQ